MHELSTAKGDFRWSWSEADSDSDSGTATPKAVPGARTPEYDADVSEISYYSMTELSENDPHRRIAASEVRVQAIAIPNTVVRRWEGYPHRFNNYEEVPLANPHPLIEHPLTLSGAYLSGSPPGPARIVVNEHDRSTPETMYHDPTKPIPPRSRYHPFSKGEYRGRDSSLPTGLEEGFGKMGI
ncbi:hypothetical protein C8A01DRAFT_20001 [Parachaetomium inaequale]|uniref:Uncharacterized protein n=1 Tax=Parachaetomium inaequale TaxID=2588326 RepID=A0AAN6SMW8_9PEZI|nr:hypothetical protein C8A01DRAFT_20001 [Parachaetomium inaequale]